MFRHLLSPRFRLGRPAGFAGAGCATLGLPGNLTASNFGKLGALASGQGGFQLADLCGAWRKTLETTTSEAYDLLMGLGQKTDYCMCIYIYDRLYVFGLKCGIGG